MQFNNKTQQKKDTSIPEHILPLSTEDIYGHKYLAVKITDLCLPSEKLIKCLS